RRALAAGLLVLALACTREGDASRPADSAGATAAGSGPASYTAAVVDSWPHDPEAFTQGLVYHGGHFFESTGLEGKSTLRRTDPASGLVLRRVEVPAPHFAEGLALLGGELFQLTWKSHLAFVYDTATLRRTRSFRYDGEGWGLTTDGESLIMSDGTSRLRFLDPATGSVRRTVEVMDGGAPVAKLNELEWVKGEVYANIWETSQIARIDPASGRVRGWIDASGLLSAGEQRGPVDVLNGIAYDPAADRLFVTGKLWPRVFQIALRRI
ncbi:MAG TPA: glutaminyl-peptide cyclotransferase, partial [Gemmatimonadaceae bacterium]|nr:glutaminyl-peptide cyclotransferase [Gemmatimonadaceae bacterium]